MKYFFLLLSFGLLFQLSAQEFEIDPGHTFIQFSVERFATVDVKGRFNAFTGTLSYDAEKNTISDVRISIDVSSIDTGHEIRDGHLTGEIWLDAVAFPEIIFVAEAFTSTDQGYLAKGQLTIHGVTQDVEIPFRMNGPMVDPTKANAIGISGTLKIDRQDYGIKFSRILDNGKLFIGNDVEITIDALAIAKT